jgi:hypothetical protein
MSKEYCKFKNLAPEVVGKTKGKLVGKRMGHNCRVFYALFVLSL